MANRLATESSLYLRQHADNPVDWYPWGGEALDRARREDRPIFLSIGYSSCHWCHVMAHESFEDTTIAAQLNAGFVCVKVDREERPDIDALYMQATLAMAGHGGWPMTVILTPDGEPFFAGTYFPPAAVHGRPGLPDVLDHARRAYDERRDDVAAVAGRMAAALREAAGPGAAGPVDRTEVDRAVTGLALHFDAEYGGFGGAPKFPPHLVLDFLIRRLWGQPSDVHAARMVDQTLGRMADGGIHDQLGGGFHRYSVDRIWLVPHFEKMLYDNALLAGVYALAHRVTGAARWRAVAERTYAYLLREMRRGDGGFAASQDADSPGGEGAFFVWSDGELRDLLGEDGHRAIALHLGVRPEGNFEGRNVLHVAASVDDVVAALGAHASALIDAGMSAMAATRAARPAPERDDALICSWNALAIRAFADGAVALERPDLAAVASEAAEVIVERLIVDGRLRRVLDPDGHPRHLAALEDHANLVIALLALYEATFDERWLERARELADRAIELFGADDGGFYATGVDAEGLIARTRDVDDNPIPGGTPQLCVGLLRLADLTLDEGYRERALAALTGTTALLGRAPQAFGTALCALDLATSPDRRQIAIVHPPDADPGEMVRAARRTGPHTALAVGIAGRSTVGLLRDKPIRDGRVTAYVCAGKTCAPPVTEAAELEALLGRDAATGRG